MKKLFLVLVSTFLCFSVFSQEKVLKFKGKAIEGKANAFKGFLVSKGHKYSSQSTDGTLYFEGGRFGNFATDIVWVQQNSKHLVVMICLAIDISLCSDSEIQTYSEHYSKLYYEKYGIHGYKSYYTVKQEDYKSKHGNLDGFQYGAFEYIPNSHYSVAFSIITPPPYNKKYFIISLINDKNKKNDNDDI